MSEVWITGAGAVSALGSGLAVHEDAVRRGRTGLAPHRFFEGRPPDPCVCGLVPESVIPSDLNLTATDRVDRLLDIAVDQATQCAALSTPVPADMIIGATIGNMQGATLYHRQTREGVTPDPALVKNFIMCAPLERVARARSVTGRRLAVSSACGSGLLALGHAFRRIKSGETSLALAGGVDALCAYVIAGFSSLMLVSKRECRPFDRDRDGLSPGEGAAVFVVESSESARRRGAVPLARIAGFGDALDAYHYTSAHPEGEGLVRAMEKALTQSGLAPADIDHLHLHGTGTGANDSSEYAACARVFGANLARIPACSTKSMTGHAFGAAGAINFLFSVLSVRTGLVPPTLFCVNLDPAFPGLSLSPEAVAPASLRTAMVTSLGFGGEAFAMAITKAGE